MYLFKLLALGESNMQTAHTLIFAVASLNLLMYPFLHFSL